MRKLILFVFVLFTFFAVTVSAQTPIAQEAPVNTSARRGGKTTEVCVTNAAGGTTVPATALQNRKTIELQNLGPNTIYCTVDGQSPLATGALGRRIIASDSWAIDIGPGVTVKCIAATAAQVTTACTMVTELR